MTRLFFWETSFARTRKGSAVAFVLLVGSVLLGGFASEAFAKGKATSPKKNENPAVTKSDDSASVAPQQGIEPISYPRMYTTKPGDTIGKIAIKFNVGVFDIKEWNDLSELSIEPNTEIIVQKEAPKPPVRKGPTHINIYHTIRPGDTFSKVAKKYRVKVSQVKSWNKKVNPRRLQLGKKLRIVTLSKVKTSSAWGKANSGRLYNGVPLKTSEVIRVRVPSRAYGTERVVRLIEAGAADVKEAYPDSAPLLVGDLSRQMGGYLRPHKSHQAGRDVDITYFYKGDVTLDRFYPMTEEVFDAVKNWHLFKTWIDAGIVQYIFVDYRLQKILYEYLLYEGYTDAELGALIEYPRRPASRGAIIRHAKGHLNHMHVRFTCGPIDIRCI